MNVPNRTQVMITKDTRKLLKQLAANEELTMCDMIEKIAQTYAENINK